MLKTLKIPKTQRIRKASYGTTDIALLCKVTPSTVANWIDEGKLSAHWTAGGHRRVNEPDLVAFMNHLKIPLPSKLQSKAPPQILIVDDDGVDRQEMVQIVRQHFPDAQIHEAVDGFQAGHKLATFRPVLVILDLMLPGMDGFEVCETIRKDPRLKGVKILAVSGLKETDIKERILNRGADDFLPKDSDPSVLVEKLKTLFALGDVQDGNN